MSERPPENERGPGKKRPGKKLVPSKDLVPVKANGSSGKVLAPKSRNFIANFLALTHQFDEQVKTFEDFYYAWRDRNYRVDLYREGEDVEHVQENLWKPAREGAEQCAADLQQLWVTINNLEDIYHPSIEYLMVRIGSMVMAWPDVKLSAPADYATRLAERLEVEDVNVMAFESLFREIEDTMKKPPAIAEVLPLLNKHKTKWQRRLDAIDLDKIQHMGETFVFALEFKHAVFDAAVLAYLDGHGHADLAAEVRDGELTSYYAAIHGSARSEGLTELVAEIEEIADAGRRSFARMEAYEEARKILIDRKHVTLEWDLLLLNANRCFNRKRPFVCTKRGAGYEKWWGHCWVCSDFTIGGHKLWEEQVAREQQKLEAELQRWQQQQIRREKSARPPDDY